MTTNTDNRGIADRRKIKRRIPEDKRPIGSSKGKLGTPAVGPGPVFWLVWLIILVVILVAWAIVLRNVSGLLVEYEEAQPKYEAEHIFNEYFKSGDYEYLITHADNIKISPAEDLDKVVAYVGGLFDGIDGEWTLTQTASAEADVLKFTVSIGTHHVADFSLVKSGKVSTKLKTDLYKLGSIDLDVSATHGANIYAPINAIVKVNGRALGSDFRYGDPVVLDEAVYFPAGDASARTMQNYFIDGLFLEPEITVTSADGSVEYTLSHDEEHASWRADGDYINRLVLDYNKAIEDEKARREEERKRENDAIRADIGPYVVKAVQTFAEWMQNETNTATRNKYFDTSSEYFRSIGKLVSQSYIMDHKGHRFDDVTDENYRYVNDDKTAIAAHVKFTHVLFDCYDKYADKSYPEWKNVVDVTVYLHLVEGKWLIYDIRND